MSRRSSFEVGEQAILCLTRAGRSREALSVGDRLLACRPPLEVFSRLQAALGTTLWNLDLADELRRRAESALAVGGTAPEAGARLAALRALALSRGQDLAAARAAGETALRAATEQLTGLPPALVITGEADVLRDEGEAYANKLREAGVPVTAVRFQGVIHDFVMLDALRETHAAEAAITLATGILHTALHAG